jgi:hypothetical protein
VAAAGAAKAPPPPPPPPVVVVVVVVVSSAPVSAMMDLFLSGCCNALLLAINDVINVWDELFQKRR